MTKFKKSNHRLRRELSRTISPITQIKKIPKSELLKCLFCQKVPKLINYSGIERDSREALPLRDGKWHDPCFYTPRSYALRHIKVKAIE